MLLIVRYSTIGDTRRAAREGDADAAAVLPSFEAQHAQRERRTSQLLSDPMQLADVESSSVRIDWDFEERDGEVWTVLRHEGVEIWREPAFWDGRERFIEVFELLQAGFGLRLTEVRPTSSSELYLYGDDLDAPAAVARLNASLTQRGSA